MPQLVQSILDQVRPESVLDIGVTALLIYGLFSLVGGFQPELRRALDRIGRVGSFGWLVSTETKAVEMVAAEVSRAAAVLSAEGHGALMVIERETGLEQIAETGVMIHGDLSA